LDDTLTKAAVTRPTTIWNEGDKTKQIYLALLSNCLYCPIVN